MVRVLWFVVLVLLSVAAVTAQSEAPDYAIRNLERQFSADSREAIIKFDVLNVGSDAAVAATAELVVLSTGQKIATATVPPLRANGIYRVSLSFPVSQFSPGSTESMRAAVGVNEVEPEASLTIQNNFAQVSITFPQTLPAESTPETTPAPEATSGPLGFLPPLGLDTSDPLQIVLVIGVGMAALVLLVIILIILRLLFRRSPDLSSWQPAYGSLFPLDSNSTPGRRHQWQTLAQNGSLPPLCNEGDVHACKRLFGIDGAYLMGWRVTGLRISQYDMYGRINRSQVVIPPKLARRLDGIVRRQSKLTSDQIEKRLRPVARGIISKLNSRLNNRSAMLPVALDLRFQGRHGDVRILFELYQCQFGQWHPLDQWEPEMIISGKTITESYTYTFYGQRPGETLKLYRQRLQDDLVRTLAEMIRPQVFNTDTTPNQVPPQVSTQTHQPKVE
ncbi:MAG TPA: hypothetical protein VHO69_09030 [Phototrophicaceae bacterium]|nr:hypothetical protein [Phototrophicaceae bacterium]